MSDKQTRIDYSQAARTYDNTRSHSDELIDAFARRAGLDARKSVLDFGCGTGNYLARIHERFRCGCFGVEPSAAMLERARHKSASVTFVQGDHRSIPLGTESFDFAYMTDVIHHVPDIGAMFRELGRVLKSSGTLCVVTESHAQVAARFYNRWFPSLTANEQRRYPDLPAVCQAAMRAGLIVLPDDTLPSTPRTVSDDFVRNVAERNWSMFRLLTDEEFRAGLAQVQQHAGQVFEGSGAGVTLLWFSKPNGSPIPSHPVQPSD